MHKMEVFSHIGSFFCRCGPTAAKTPLKNKDLKSQPNAQGNFLAAVNCLNRLDKLVVPWLGSECWDCKSSPGLTAQSRHSQVLTSKESVKRTLEFRKQQLAEKRCIHPFSIMPIVDNPSSQLSSARNLLTFGPTNLANNPLRGLTTNPKQANSGTTDNKCQ